MISSMTGYGRGEIVLKGMTAVAEVRSVNSRYLEVSSRLPRTIAQRENDVKELVRSKCARGKITITVSVVRGSLEEVPVQINIPAARAYVKLLNELKKA